MLMVCGLDLHREQITFDALVVESGESWRGRVWHPDRGTLPALVHEVTRHAQGGSLALALAVRSLSSARSIAWANSSGSESDSVSRPRRHGS